MVRPLPDTRLDVSLGDFASLREQRNALYLSQVFLRWGGEVFVAGFKSVAAAAF